MKLELGDIEETLFYSSGENDVDYEMIQQDEHASYLIGFCIDVKGRVRESLGIVSSGVLEDDNFDYVPSVRYEIEHSAWNSHSEYVEMNLPNPAVNVELYHLIRTAMIAEFTRRLKRQIKNAKARLARKAA